MLQGSTTKLDGDNTVNALRPTMYALNKDGLLNVTSSGNYIIDAVLQSFWFLVAISAIPHKLFFREKLGERTFSPFALIVCISFYFVYLGYYGNFYIPYIGLGSLLGLVTENWGIYMPIMLQLFLVSPVALFLAFSIRMGIRHLKEVYEEAENSEFVRYSFDRGSSRYYGHLIGKYTNTGKKITDEYLRLNYEPRIAFRVGLLFILLSCGILKILTIYEIYNYYIQVYMGYTVLFGFAIWHSALCAHIEEVSIKLRKRGRLLDITDGEYDVAYLQAERSKLKLADLKTETTSISQNDGPFNNHNIVS